MGQSGRFGSATWKDVSVRAWRVVHDSTNHKRVTQTSKRDGEPLARGGQNRLHIAVENRGLRRQDHKALLYEEQPARFGYASLYDTSMTFSD